MDFTEQIMKLRDTSETVEQFISTGAYMLQFDSLESIDPQILLNKCYQVMVDELVFLGIISNVSFEELISDYYNAEAIIAIRKIVDKENLIPILRSCEQFKEMIVNLVSSKDIAESVYFSEFLDSYQTHFPGDSNILVVSRLESAFISNYEFKNYILSLNKLSIPLSNMDETNLEMRSQFLKKITEGRVYFEAAVKTVLQLDPSLDREYLNHVINLYDIEKIQAGVIDEMSWAVMTDPETLDESLRKRRQHILESHYKSTSHHIEYYIANRKNPTTEQLVELTAHHYEPGSTEEEFRLAVNNMFKVATSAENLTQFVVMSTDDINYSLRISTEILKLYNEQ